MMQYSKVVSKLISLQPMAILLLSLICVGLFILNVVRGEHIMNLQSELLKYKEQKVEVIINAAELANEADSKYVKEKTTHEIRVEKVKGDTETIIKENTVFLNVCISDDGVRSYNEFVSASDASEPSNGMQEPGSTK